MKKLLLIAAIAVTAMFATSCQGPAGPMGPQGPSGYANMDSYDVKLFTKDWTWKTDDNGWNGYLYQDVDFPEISIGVCNYGVVLAYLKFDGYQELLSTHLWIDEGEGIMYNQGISFAYKPGHIRFYYNRSDFEYPNDKPETMEFRVIIMY